MLNSQRAFDLDPADPHVLFWSAQVTPDRATAIERLSAYLERAPEGDTDRIDAARSAIGLYRALGERAVWVVDERPDRIELPLRRLWDPETGNTLGYVVRVKLGDRDKPVPLMLDTGSPGLYVIRRSAKKRGFAPVAEQLSFGGGGDGRLRSQRGFFSEIAIGELRFRHVLATVDRHEVDPLGRFHGLIGLSVFEGYRVTLDLGLGRMILELGEPVEGGSRYWDIQGQMLTSVSIGDAIEGLALFDTGATRTLVSQDWASRVPGARLGPVANVHALGGLLSGARVLDGLEVTFQGLGVGRDGLRAVDLGLRSRIAGVEIAAFLGLDLLAERTIVVDTVGRRLTVEMRDEP